MSRKIYIRDIVINTVIVFLAYLAAVLIRYRILRSEPGIDALSAPYLIIAAVYSFLISFTFDYEEQPRWLTNSSSMNSLFNLISKNAIGCLLLLAAFYMTGIVHFSRWALFLFWVLSSMGLFIKKGIDYTKTARNRAAGLDQYRVLIIGDGERAERYIRSVSQNPQLGIKIVGYMGKSDRLRTDIESFFDPEENTEPVIEWLGEYDAAKIRDVDEVMIAQDLTDAEVVKILETASRQNIKTSLSLHNAPFLLDETKIRDLGEAKNVGLNEREKETNVYITGVVFSTALLLLLLIIKRFNMGAMETLWRFGSYRSVIFGVFSFFLFLTLSYRSKKIKLLRRIAAVWGISAAAVLVFELIYGGTQAIRTNLIVISVVIGVCGLISYIEESIDQSGFTFMD